ncbi:MAG TPA: lysophospholipid acyltransferase family protein [Thermoanaerobaculia bacterium]|nr:lysophospholipid acyltransferase family protein [Thermoanaerobaculia bacterium]
MRGAITAFFRICLRVFFRRIELVGLERIPQTGAVIFAVNHPNGLVDPLFLLCFAPRPVSFLAKAPLFRMFFIGAIVRAFEAIPVYRKQDNTGGSNRETFAAARGVLGRGGSIAIFPEGTTHDDPSLRELKTGAARIALGATLDEMTVIPTGIYYTAKHVFRSSALVVFGEPLRVETVDVDAEGEPAHEEVERLTNAIDAGLDAVTLQADSHAALTLIAKAEDIFTADDDQPLVEEFDLRRRFIAGYHFLHEHDPARLHRLETSIARFERALQRARLDVHELKPHIDVLRVLRAIVLLPLAIVGALVNYPAYRLVGALARRYSKGEGAMVATVKFVAALLLYPLTYLAIAILVAMRFGVLGALIAIVALPFVSYLALFVFEELDDLAGDLRAIGHRVVRRSGHERLLLLRRHILEEMAEIAREMEGAT